MIAAAAAAIVTLVTVAALVRRRQKPDLSPWLAEFYSRPKNRKELK